jgi:hypothetical protein
MAGVNLPIVEEKLMLLSLLSAFAEKPLPADFPLEELSQTTQIPIDVLPEKLFVLSDPLALSSLDCTAEEGKKKTESELKYCDLSVNLVKQTVTVRVAQPRTFPKESWGVLRELLVKSQKYLTLVEDELREKGM